VFKDHYENGAMTNHHPWHFAPQPVRFPVSPTLSWVFVGVVTLLAALTCGGSPLRPAEREPALTVVLAQDPLEVFQGESVSLTGTVKNQDEAPVDGADVTINWGDAKPHDTVQTADGGVFEKSHQYETAGSFDIIVTAEQAGVVSDPAMAKAVVRVVPQSLSVKLIETPLQVKQGTPVSIQGTVVDQEGEAVADAKVTIDWGDGQPASKPTDDRGSFTVEYIYPKAGSFKITVTAEKAGFAPHEATVTAIARGLKLTLGDGPLRIAQGTSFTLQGTVRDQGGKAVPNAAVTINWGDQKREETVPAGKNGRFEKSHQYELARSFKITVTAEKPGFAPHEATVTAIAQALKLKLDSKELQTGRGEPLTIRGAVTDQGGGPAADATVTIAWGDGPEEKVELNDKGAFEHSFDPMEAGKFTIVAKAEKEGFAPSETKAEVTVKGLRLVNLRSSPDQVERGDELTLRGAVLDHEGGFVEGATVTITWGPGDGRTTTLQSQRLGIFHESRRVSSARTLKVRIAAEKGGFGIEEAFLEVGIAEIGQLREVKSLRDELKEAQKQDEDWARINSLEADRKGLQRQEARLQRQVTFLSSLRESVVPPILFAVLLFALGAVYSGLIFLKGIWRSRISRL